MTDSTLIAEFQRNRRDKFRISISEYRGTRFIDLRIHVPGKQGEYVPTAKGCTVQPDALCELIAALQQAQAALSNNPTA
jgi:Transcriptional Coactivator p15 (PC4)